MSWLKKPFPSSFLTAGSSSQGCTWLSTRASSGCWVSVRRSSFVLIDASSVVKVITAERDSLVLGFSVYAMDTTPPVWPEAGVTVKSEWDEEAFQGTLAASRTLNEPASPLTEASVCLSEK